MWARIGRTGRRRPASLLIFAALMAGSASHRDCSGCGRGSPAAQDRGRSQGLAAQGVSRRRREVLQAGSDHGSDRNDGHVDVVHLRSNRHAHAHGRDRGAACALDRPGRGKRQPDRRARTARRHRSARLRSCHCDNGRRAGQCGECRDRPGRRRPGGRRCFHAGEHGSCRRGCASPCPGNCGAARTDGTPKPATTTAAAAPPASRVAAVRAIEKPQTNDPADDEYSYGFRLWEAKFYPEARQQLKMFVDKYPRHSRVSASAATCWAAPISTTVNRPRPPSGSWRTTRPTSAARARRTACCCWRRR
jgi:hypothetical protein